MSSSNNGILTIGTANVDEIYNVSDVSAYWSDGILDGKANQTAPAIIRGGGSAVNTSHAINAIARAQDLKITAYKSMRLGTQEDNPGKDVIMAEFDYPTPNDKTISDGMCKTGYKVPRNVVFENGQPGHRGRFIARDFNKAGKFPLFPGIRDDINHALNHCEVVIGNSSPHEETEIAFYQAKMGRDSLSHNTTIYDYSEKNMGDAVQRAAWLLQYADIVVAPHDAMLPGMTRTNPKELLGRLVTQYKRTQVAVSDSDNKVLVYDNGKRFDIEIRKILAKNVCGAGDTRDAALGVFAVQGHKFRDAIVMATEMATRYVGHESRDAFEEALYREAHPHKIVEQHSEIPDQAAAYIDVMGTAVPEPG